MIENVEEFMVASFPQLQLELLGSQFREEDRSAEGFPSRERLSSGKLTTHEWTDICYCWSFLSDTERISIVPALARIWATEVFVECSQFPSAYYTFLYKTRIIDGALSSRQRSSLWEYTKSVFNAFANKTFELKYNYTEYTARLICTFNSISIIWGEMGQYIRERWMLKDVFSCKFVLTFYQGMFEGLEYTGSSQGMHFPVHAKNIVAMTNTCYFDYDHLHFPVQSQKALSRIVQIQKVQSALVKLTKRLDSARDLSVARELKSCCDKHPTYVTQRCCAMDHVYRVKTLFGIELTWTELVDMLPGPSL